MFRKIRRAACLCLALILAFAFPVSASASGTGGTGSIDVCYEIDEKPVTSKEFQLYKVGMVNDRLEFSWTNEYAAYNLDLDTSSAEVMHTLPSVLAGYVSRDKKTPVATATTDESGKCSFEDLPEGMYLLTGKSWSSGNYTYYIVPVLICLPFTNADHILSMHATVEVKHESLYHPPYVPPTPTPTPAPSEPPKQSVSVVKRWDVRPGTVVPGSISVDLLCDGQLYSRVELSADTGWNYNWFNLPEGHEWMVIETAVPDGFVGSLRRNGSSFVVVNLEEGKPPEEPIESPEPTPVITEPPVPSTPPIEPDLPQTGLVKWPIAAFAAAGVICIVAGELIDRNSRKKRSGNNGENKNNPS
mgnify:CR=1 FL=1